MKHTPLQPTEYERENAPSAPPEEGMEALLEKQIARCSDIIDRIADIVSQDGLTPNVCVNFVSRLPSLMTSSAAVGKIAWQFRESTRKKLSAT